MSFRAWTFRSWKNVRPAPRLRHRFRRLLLEIVRVALCGSIQEFWTILNSPEEKWPRLIVPCICIQEFVQITQRPYRPTDHPSMSYQYVINIHWCLTPTQKRTLCFQLTRFVFQTISFRVSMHETHREDSWPIDRKEVYGKLTLSCGNHIKCLTFDWAPR